tara:strand:+ start:4151 stop:5062 length:912 start_codon:yes stop_codon:yes gene_type:complete
MQRIAYIGLGNMGFPMAAHLVQKGFKVDGFDLDAAVREQLPSIGVSACSTIKEVVAQADVIISMLPADQHVLDVYISGQYNLLSLASKARLIIDCSTISAQTAVTLFNAAKAQGIPCIDAPVSGGIGGAKSGQLTFICGGEQEHVTQAEPILLAMGSQVFYAGEAGCGQIAKMCNNMLLAICMIGTSEALQLGIDFGLDPKILSDIMRASSGNNWTLEKYNPCPGVMAYAPAAQDYQTGFMVDLMNKDLNLAMQATMQSKTATPLGMLARSLYQQHARQGYGQRDFSSIFKLFAQLPELATEK